VEQEEMDNVIKYISQYGVIRLESSPPTLDDLFMRHYKDHGGEA